MSYEDFKNFISSDCHYCGVRPLRIYSHKQYYGELFCNGIDRVDSKEGYKKENCVTCCYICNRAKMDMEYSRFIDYLNEVTFYRGSYVGQ